MRTQYKDFVLLHFIVLLWGFTAILGLLIKIPPLELVFFRTLLASLGLLLIIFFKKLPLLVTPRYTIKLLVTGFVIAAHWILFFGSARISTASVCLAGMATTSFWTSLIEPIVNRKKIQPLEVFFGMLVIAGLYLIFHFEFNHALGLALALVSALLAAIFTVINSKLTHKHNQYTISFYEMLGACMITGFVLLIYTIIYNPVDYIFTLPSSTDWFFLIVLALVCTVYPFAVSIELMKRISAFLVNLSINMEPVYGIILAFIIFGDKEKMNLGFYMGTLVILASVILYPIIRSLINKRRLKLPG